MLEIHRKAILRALGLNADLNPDKLRADPKHTHGIKRNRFYFRNYNDCSQVPKTMVLPLDDMHGPLLDSTGSPIPFGPLLRVRSVLGHEVFQLSWTAYQPISLVWDYPFWGGKSQFQAKCKMQSSDSIPALDFANSLPPHYLRAWNQFVRSLRQQNVSTFDRDRLVRAILPIFHHPYVKAPMRILNCEEVQKLAGLHHHFDRVSSNRNLLTELTIRNYCGNSFHPEYIQAAIGHPERLRKWLTAPVDPPNDVSWTGVIHPKQARLQYHALREQVQTLAKAQRVRDLENKQVGIDPMPDFPIHAIEGSLTPVMPEISQVQLLPSSRKFHPDDLGIKENKPPPQLSTKAIQLLQQDRMHALLTGMRFFGAGVGHPDEILRFFFGDNAEAAIDQHCPQAKHWVLAQLRSSARCTQTMAQTLLWIYSLLHKTQQSVHIVHLVDWEDQAQVTSIGDAPAQWTVYCVQLPRSHAFQIDTAAWNCYQKIEIPWQPAPHLVVHDAAQVHFCCTNSKCKWFAVPYGPNGQYLVHHATIGTFLYDRCIPCLFSNVITQISCRIHTATNSCPELTGFLFVDNDGNVAVAAAHEWSVDTSAKHQTCLVTARIDNRMLHYPAYSDSLPAIQPIGKVTADLCAGWHTNESFPKTAFFLCTLSEEN